MKHARVSTEAPAATHQRGDIQGLRAVAVGSVVLSHAGFRHLAGGYVGVDVFFVISGFLITGILAREVKRTGRVSVVDFYARRARRILPAASVALVAVALTSWLAFGYIRTRTVLHDIVWSALFGANIHFAQAGTDYFATDSFPSPVQHFWSLAVEEQFYVVWPTLIAIVALVLRRRIVAAVFGILAVVCVASFAYSVTDTAANATGAYFSTLTRAWELGAGALLALALPYVARIPRAVRTVAGWVGLGLILYACFAFDDHTSFPGATAAVPVLGAVLILGAGVAPTPFGASAILSIRPMRWIGDISYSLYLVHWPVLIIPMTTMSHHFTILDRLGLIAVALLLATASYRWVETPFRDSSFWSGRKPSLALWPAAVAIVLAATTLVSLQTTPAVASAVELDPAQKGTVNIQRAIVDAAARARAHDALPHALTPSPLDLKSANWQLPPQCWASTADTTHQVCTFGDTSARRSIVLLGDSHMGFWSGPIIKIATEQHWKVYIFLKTGCPPMDVTMWRSDRQNVYTECTAFRTWAYAQIRTIHPERIIIAGYTRSAITNSATGSALDSADNAGFERLVRPGMASALTTLRSITPDVSVIGDTSSLPSVSSDCLGRKNANLGTCVTGFNAISAQRNALWQQVAREVGAHFIDVEPWLCPGGLCPLVVGNVIVYTDNHHLTRTFADVLIPLLRPALRL